MPSVSLVCVVWGPIYERYARELVASAELWFLGGQAPVVLEGEPGWPNSSSCRYRRVLEELERIPGEWIFLVDADMRFEAPVGEEILGPSLTVTSHPGYPALSDPATWPYERRPESSAYVAPGEEAPQYFPGAFVGGRRAAFVELAESVSAMIARDAAAGVDALWYDESYLNRYLASSPPARPLRVLDGSYCYWDYWGPEPGPRGELRRLVHLDKTTDEFTWRGRPGSPDVLAERSSV